MHSMTGFGKSNHQSKSLILEVSIKTVNGRYLEPRLHCPRIYQPLEPDIRKQISKFFLRGTVDVYINRRSLQGDESVYFNHQLAKTWLEEFSVLNRKLKLNWEPKAEMLLGVPDIYKAEESNQIQKGEKKHLLSALASACKACQELRHAEGLNLNKAIQGYLKNLISLVAKISKKKKLINKNFSEKFDQKIQRLSQKTDIDPQRLAQELVLFQERSDVSEEIARLESHLEMIQKLTGVKSQSIGKKLDFFAQELLREVNTIGSKSSDAGLTQLVVEAKGIIEKYREQVQNIE